MNNIKFCYALGLVALLVPVCGLAKSYNSDVVDNLMPARHSDRPQSVNLRPSYSDSLRSLDGSYCISILSIADQEMLGSEIAGSIDAVSNMVAVSIVKQNESCPQPSRSNYFFLGGVALKDALNAVDFLVAGNLNSSVAVNRSLSRVDDLTRPLAVGWLDGRITVTYSINDAGSNLVVTLDRVDSESEMMIYSVSYVSKGYE